MRPLTFRGIAAIVLGIGCFVAAQILATPALLYFGVLLLLLVLIAFIAVRAPRRRGTVSRTVSTELLTVGEISAVRVQFGLRSPLGTPTGTWTDALPKSVSGVASGVFPPHTLAGLPPARANSTQPIVFDYHICGERRGHSALGPLSLRTIDPFGLVRSSQEFGEVTRVTVAPAVVALEPLAESVGAAGGTAQTSSSRLGQGADNLAPRRYVSGDSMRRIHWRATAHRGDLMVRQEEQESSPDAVVVLDLAGTRWAEGPEIDAAFESAVSMCASAALHLSQHGFGVDVLDATGQMIGELRGGDDERELLLGTLAAVEPRFGATSPALSPSTFGHLLGPLVVITGAVDIEEAEHLRHGGAAMPILLSTAPSPGALAAANNHGWHTATLDDDVASSWADALHGSAQ